MLYALHILFLDFVEMLRRFLGSNESPIDIEKTKQALNQMFKSPDIPMNYYAPRRMYGNCEAEVKSLITFNIL